LRLRAEDIIIMLGYSLFGSGLWLVRFEFNEADGVGLIVLIIPGAGASKDSGGLVVGKRG
jgi:hypothetical protein